MAEITISIKDEQTAKQWLTMVEDLNSDYQQAMHDAGQTLVDVQEFSEGTMVDELVKYGTDLMNAAETTFTAIAEISGTVNTVLSKVNDFVQNTLGGLGKLASAVLGH